MDWLQDFSEHTVRELCDLAGVDEIHSTSIHNDAKGLLKETSATETNHKYLLMQGTTLCSSRIFSPLIWQHPCTCEVIALVFRWDISVTEIK